jgi:hypothetical protein
LVCRRQEAPNFNFFDPLQMSCQVRKLPLKQTNRSPRSNSQRLRTDGGGDDRDGHDLRRWAPMATIVEDVANRSPSYFGKRMETDAPDCAHRRRSS